MNKLDVQDPVHYNRSEPYTGSRLLEAFNASITEVFGVKFEGLVLDFKPIDCGTLKNGT